MCVVRCVFNTVYFLPADGFYVTWGASEGGGVMAPGQSLPPHGKSLGRLDFADLRQVIHKVSVGVCLYCVGQGESVCTNVSLLSVGSGSVWS